MKIKIAQIDVIGADLKHNFKQIEKVVNEAKKEDVDLVVFNEMCVSGYLLSDLYLDKSFCKEVLVYNEKINELSDNIGIIYGSLAANFDQVGKDGSFARYNALYFYYNQKNMLEHLGGYYIKKLLPTYRYFDDERYFINGLSVDQEAAIVTFKGMNIGLEICEDMWDDNYPQRVNDLYHNCDMLIDISASPYVVNKENTRIAQAQKIIQNHNLKYFVYANCVGMQNNGKNILMFDGNSFVMSNKGLIAQLDDCYQKDAQVVDLNNAKLLEPYRPKDNKLYLTLINAIKKFDEVIFNQRFNWVIGLSGGLDSAINAALLTKALGADRVKAYNMASNYNSATTKGIASELASKLGIELKNGSIEKITQATCETLNNYGYDVEIPSLTYENMQARVRGHLLSSFASLENGVICNNGNKVEIALGYCTLYGDTIGAMSPIGDLTKVDLFNLAKQINEDFGEEIIDHKLLPDVNGEQINWVMPPSAELKNDQVDPMKWFYHDVLIKVLIEDSNVCALDILKAYQSGELQRSSLGKWIKYYGLDEPKAFIDDFKWLLRTIQLAYFKRIQMPPIVSVSARSFGYDYRESQLPLHFSDEFEEIVDKIVEK